MLMKAILMVIVALAASMTAACSSIATTSASPSTAVLPQPTTVLTTAITAEPAVTEDTVGLNASLAVFLADPLNGQLVADRGVELNGGQGHNACVFTAAEALRRVGCDIPDSTGYTPVLVKQLTDMGFSLSYQLSDLQPGDICFTTDEKGGLEGVPTHTFIFLAWEGQDVMRIFDNQSYDYGSPYHLRSPVLTYFNDQADRPKEATAFYMRKK